MFELPLPRMCLTLDNHTRVKVYNEGGFTVQTHVDGIGWCLCDDPPTDSELALAFRSAANKLTELASRL